MRASPSFPKLPTAAAAAAVFSFLLVSAATFASCDARRQRVLGPGGFSKIIKKPSRFHRFDVSLSESTSRNFLCDTCFDISTFAEDVLTDPDTLANIIEYVNGSLCKSLSSFQEECIDLAEEYVPDLLEKLQIYAAPDKLCSETKICPSSSLLLVNEVHSCKICIDFTTEALSYIQSGKAETEVLEALHSQCSKLGDFSSQCDSLIDTYAPVYIQKIDSVTPDQLCEKIGICSSVSKGDPSHCATCEFAVFQLKAKLQNPLVQKKMLEMLLDGCSKVPEHIDQCKELITQYGPSMLEKMDKYVDPEAICTEIHACENKKKWSTDMLIQLPSSHDSIAHQ